MKCWEKLASENQIKTHPEYVEKDFWSLTHLSAVVSCQANNLHEGGGSAEVLN